MVTFEACGMFVLAYDVSVPTGPVWRAVGPITAQSVLDTTIVSYGSRNTIRDVLVMTRQEMCRMALDQTTYEDGSMRQLRDKVRELLRAGGAASAATDAVLANKYDALQSAVAQLYTAAHWTADRDVDAPRLWEAVRDAAGIEPGNAPKPSEELGTDPPGVGISSPSIIRGTHLDGHATVNVTLHQPAPAGAFLQVHTAQGVRIDATLRDANGTVIDSSTGSRCHEKLRMAYLPPGEYRVDLQAQSGAGGWCRLDCDSGATMIDSAPTTRKTTTVELPAEMLPGAAIVEKVVAGRVAPIITPPHTMVTFTGIERYCAEEYPFTITAPMPFGAYVQVIPSGKDAQVDARVTDAAGTVVGEAVGDLRHTRIVLSNLAAGSYTVTTTTEQAYARYQLIVCAQPMTEEPTRCKDCRWFQPAYTAEQAKAHGIPWDGECGHPIDTEKLPLCLRRHKVIGDSDGDGCPMFEEAADLSP